MISRVFSRPSIYYVLAFTTVPLVLTTYSLLTPTYDRVQLSNTTGSESGILVVGQASPPNIYKSYVSHSGSFRVGPLALNAINNEVVAFTNGRAVDVKPLVPWTTGIDTVNMSLTGPIVIDVTMWIVRGDFPTGFARATAMKLATMSIWDQERMGVTFGAFDIRDATSPGTALFSHFDSTCLMRNSLQTTVGHDVNRINIYMVDQVNNDIGSSNSCGFGTGFIAMALGASNDLLAHEIGHNFWLRHIDMLPNFDETNVMHPASITRQYFTEGQLFRAHLSSNSVLNTFYHARPHRITRDCAATASSETCPPIDKRIWQDGAFPPN